MSDKSQTDVTLAAADPGAQVIVIDASFQQLAIGVGRLQVRLRPGIYKARFKAGDRIEDKLFEVRDQPLLVQAAALQFSSPIPLPGTSNNHEYHYAPSRARAANPPLARLGAGGEAFVFARDSSQAEDQPPALAQWHGLRIRDASHGVIFDIETAGDNNTGLGFASAKLVLSPGLYFLAQPDCTHPDMLTELPFVVCGGWCTHVYVDCKSACTPRMSAPDADTQRVLDLAGAAVVMLPMGQAVPLDDEVGRLSEIARQGLSRGQEAVSEEDLTLMIYGKRRFPMLGLYAAHVLLARRKPNWAQIAMIATNLSSWLGSHPDVDVLLELCRRHGADVPKGRSLLWPPVLAASWDRALEHDIDPPISDARGDWLRQYRVGGSIWSCLFGPSRLPEIAVRGTLRNHATVETSENFGIDLGTTDSRVRVRAPAPPSFGGPDGKGLGGDNTKSINTGGGAYVAGNVHLTGGDFIGRDKVESVGSWQGVLTKALQYPDPYATPFQQAVRRRVLDLLADPDEPLTLSTLSDHIASLARQFRVPVAQAREVLAQLREQFGRGDIGGTPD